MSDADLNEIDKIDESGGPMESRAHETRAYVKGGLASLVLTAIPVLAVVWGALPIWAVWSVIAAAGLLQVAAQLRWFLHLRLKGQAFEDLQLILFTLLILVLMIGGTIWVMSDLTARMM